MQINTTDQIQNIIKGLAEKEKIVCLEQLQDEISHQLEILYGNNGG